MKFEPSFATFKCAKEFALYVSSFSKYIPHQRGIDRSVLGVAHCEQLRMNVLLPFSP